MLRYLLLAIVLISSGCTSQEEVEMLYFYSPSCPNCIAVAPFIDYIEEEYSVDINHYDASKQVNRQSFERYNVTAVPTLIVLDGVEQRFVGRYEVVEAEYLIAEMTGAKPPQHPFNTTLQTDPAYCLKCHKPTEEQKELLHELLPPQELESLNTTLPPPSTYSCSYCCHRG